MYLLWFLWANAVALVGTRGLVRANGFDRLAVLTDGLRRSGLGVGRTGKRNIGSFSVGGGDGFTHDVLGTCP